MRIERIELKDYRNYVQLSLPLERGINVLCGANAQGKTNVLESIYLCCLGRSHKTRSDAELVRRGTAAAFARVDVMRNDGPRQIEVLLKSNERKRILVSGLPIRRMSELMGHVQCVFFSPDDLMMVKGGPGLRRRFLDSSLCQLRPGYYLALSQYNAALMQRNALLRRERTAHSDQLLDAFDQTLAVSGARVVEHRRSFLSALNDLACVIHADIANGEPLSLHYRGLQAQGDITRALLDALQRSRTDDYRRCTTLVGPHRDDLVLSVAGLDARLFASQGQQRTAALSLKLAAAEAMKAESGLWPVLLLDDVFSELDQARRRGLIDRIGGQALITTAGEVPGYLNGCATYRVEKGAIERV
ncbi:MAG: DNA replication/repair protein RecF [Clostridia bacterium]|nr:DNA replication/repair protein RecF [Clostridia bacterium]